MRSPTWPARRESNPAPPSPDVDHRDQAQSATGRDGRGAEWRTQARSELDRRHGGRGHDADGRLSTLAGRCDRGELKLAANVDCGARVTRMCGVAHECVTRCGESIWPPHNSPNRASDATTRISYALLVVVIRIRSPVRRSSSRSRSMIFRPRKKVPSLLRATSVGISCQVGRGFFSPMRVDCTRARARLAGFGSRDRFAL